MLENLHGYCSSEIHDNIYSVPTEDRMVERVILCTLEFLYVLNYKTCPSFSLVPNYTLTRHFSNVTNKIRHFYIYPLYGIR